MTMKPDEAAKVLRAHRDWWCGDADAHESADMEHTPDELSRALDAAVAALEAVAVPDDLRALGLTVAVHNDYRLNGVPHTFWLFVGPDGMSYKGEGRTDAEALNQVRDLLAASQQAAKGEGT